ncbi:MAG: hypothetical protein AMXMBFR25_17690 [Lysobacterales bacterium]|nr:hypothetical protein [Xanthomonadales bacterium]
MRLRPAFAWRGCFHALAGGGKRYTPRMDWNANWRPAPPQALSPCIGVCTLDANGLCEGCLRTSAEIGAWGSLPDHERRRIMSEVLPLRERRRD